MVQLYLYLVAPAGSKDEGDASGGSAVVNFLLKAWNLFLAFASLVMLLGLMIPLVSFGVQSSFKDNICDHARVRWTGSAPFWVYVFVFSKYFELIDTVFLMVRGKPVNFLHW